MSKKITAAIARKLELNTVIETFSFMTSLTPDETIDWILKARTERPTGVELRFDVYWHDLLLRKVTAVIPHES